MQKIEIGLNPKRKESVYFTRSNKRNRFGSRMFYTPYHINATDAFVPEIWANEAIRVLYENMIFPSTVHTDFNNEIASYGQIIHTRKPGELKAKRKQNDFDDLSDQDITATDIEVKLDQRIYVSFLVGDLERTVSMVELIEQYLPHAMLAEARILDQIVASQVYQFLGNSAGGLGTMTSVNSHDLLLDARKVMNDNKTGIDSRWLALTSPSETLMQKNLLFKSAEQIGDAGQALRNAYLGRVAGFNTFLELNTPSVRGALTVTGTTLSAAASAGATSVSFTAAPTVGSYVTIAGEMSPHRVIAAGTLSRPLRSSVASGAVVTIYEVAAVNQTSAIAANKTHGAVANGYPKGWLKEIVYDGTGVPQVGQLVSFKNGSTVLAKEYAIVQVDTVAKTILLDQSLVEDVADNAVICLGPNGDYNFCYQRNAITMVNRALVLPVSGNIRSARASFNGMNLRVNISYDDKKEAHRVAISGLFGVTKLDTAYGTPLLS